MVSIPLLAILGLSAASLALGNPIDAQEVLQVDSPVHTSSSWEWSDCGSPDDVIEIKSVKVSPDPPVPGKNMTVEVSGYVSSTIK
ncbi:hypothetical protein H0H87_005507, partial [Tephrocybe sp. NHM501043]